MVNYIAAGLDPARFWEITVRLYEVEMRGALARHERDMEKIWLGAMLPHFKEVPSIDKFVGRKVSHKDVARCLAAWDKLDAALAANANRKLRSAG